jgi:hypothetical protein
MTQTLEPPAPPDDDLDPPAPPPGRTEPTTATRYLCVGAYIDRTFRNRALREVYHERRRFVAPSRAFDLVAVLETCRRARTLEILQDGSIVLALVAAIFLNWISVAVVVAALLCLRVTGAAWRLTRAFLARARTGTAVDTTKSPRHGLMMLLGWAATVIVLVVLAAKAVSMTIAATALGDGVGLGSALLLAVAVFVLPSIFALWRQKRIEEFATDAPPPPRHMTGRMREIKHQQSGNTVVYSNFEPFIGSGDVIRSWSFPQRLVEKESDTPGANSKSELKREFAFPPFSANEIVGYVREKLQELAAEEAPELGIPDMSVDDRIFQSAREFGKKTPTTEPDEIEEIIRNPTTPRRHYLACQGIGWGGDIVTTVHVHLAVQAKELYVEVTSTLLAPCNDRYRVVDTDDGTGPRAWLRVLLDALRWTPWTISHAPGRLVRSVADIAGRGGGAARPRSRRKDHGALVSVRQLGTRDRLRNFTQVQDVLKFRKLIESRVYAHVLDFLEERGVDTSDVRAQRTTILNNNGIFFGGDAAIGDNGSVSNQVSVSPEPRAD